MNTALRSLLSPRRFEHAQVVVSSSNNVYKNLALEDWIYKNIKFIDATSSRKTRPELFIIWKNNPCVVVGRHQNTWVEVNVNQALKQDVHVARRRSGGGTVYHDLGNLNLTFFTSRQHYNRQRNLNFIADHLRRNYNLDVSINKRDDLVLNDMFKISGTAAKLGSSIAYHHFTLLVDADLENAKKILHGSKDGIHSRATASTSSPVANLVDFRPQLTTEELTQSLVKAYSFADVNVNDITIDPSNEEHFPGLQAMQGELENWSWVYGHTPKFTLEQNFTLLGIPTPINIKLDVDKGIISNIVLDSSDKLFTNRYNTEVIENATRPLLGMRYWADDLKVFLRRLEHIGDLNSDRISLTRWLVSFVLSTF